MRSREYFTLEIQSDGPRDSLWYVYGDRAANPKSMKTDMYPLKCSPHTSVTVAGAPVVRRGDIAANNETFRFPRKYAQAYLMAELLSEKWLSPFISPGLIYGGRDGGSIVYILRVLCVPVEMVCSTGFTFFHTLL